MKKLSENLFAPAFDRSRTGEDRRENTILNSNFKEIEFIDCDCSVLWADRDLVIDEKNIFSKNEKDSIGFPKGYRYPTEDEFWELCEVTDRRVYRPNQDNTIKLKDIYFDMGHYFLDTETRLIEISVTVDDKKMFADTCWDGIFKHIKIRLVKEK